MIDLTTRESTRNIIYRLIADAGRHRSGKHSRVQMINRVSTFIRRYFGMTPFDLPAYDPSPQRRAKSVGASANGRTQRASLLGRLNKSFEKRDALDRAHKQYEIDHVRL